MAENACSADGDAAEIVAAAWADVLGVPVVERDVGVFELGADSRQVLEVVGRLREWWPALRAVDVFAHPTVTSLAALLDGER